MAHLRDVVLSYTEDICSAWREGQLKHSAETSSRKYRASVALGASSDCHSAASYVVDCMLPWSF